MTLYLMEPELEELLHTIARDPRSTLLRVDRPTILRGLFDRDPMVRESCTQLTSAERQLLRAHRSELAGLLREVCFDLLSSQTVPAYFYCLDQGSGTLSTSRRSWEALLRAIRDSVAQAGRHVQVAVASAVASRNPLDYASLAHRIFPNSTSALYLSDCFQQLNQKANEKRAIYTAWSLATGGRALAHVYSYLGCFESRELHLRDAVRSHRAAFKLGDRWPNEVLSWLALSVQCASEIHLTEALQALETTKVSRETLVGWTSNQLTLRTKGTWRATPESEGFWQAHRDKAGEDASHVLGSLFGK